LNTALFFFLFYPGNTEPVFVNLLRSPIIDSQPRGLVRQPYLTYWPARLHTLAEPIPRNQFLRSINVYKYGLRVVMAGARRERELLSKELYRRAGLRQGVTSFSSHFKGTAK
jgi:hypothetical protein